MRRAARLVLYGGIDAIVLGPSKMHVAWVAEYSWHSSSRFAWSPLLGAGAILVIQLTTRDALLSRLEVSRSDDVSVAFVDNLTFDVVGHPATLAAHDDLQAAHPKGEESAGRHSAQPGRWEGTNVVGAVGLDTIVTGRSRPGDRHIRLTQSW